LRRGRAACHCVDGRRALSAFNASRPIRWQAARLLGLLANSAPVPGSALCYPFYKKLPLHAEDTQISDDRTQGIAPAANIYSPKCYILYVPGPTCRGSVPLCMPPSAIKGEACDVTRHIQAQTHNTLHSGVGCYAPVARTTLNPHVLSCVHPPVS
jgi:hypothetical protein